MWRCVIVYQGRDCGSKLEVIVCHSDFMAKVAKSTKIVKGQLYYQIGIQVIKPDYSSPILLTGMEKRSLLSFGSLLGLFLEE